MQEGLPCIVIDGRLQELNFSGMGWGDPKVECLQCLHWSVEVGKKTIKNHQSLSVTHTVFHPYSLDLSDRHRIGSSLPCRFRPLWLCVVLPASCWTCRVRPRQNFVVSWKQLECAHVRLCNRPWASLASLSHFAMSEKEWSKLFLLEWPKRIITATTLSGWMILNVHFFEKGRTTKMLNSDLLRELPSEVPCSSCGALQRET